MRGSSIPLHSRGFTLIEVLAALVIISLGMLAVIEAVTQTLNNANYLREKTVAHWVAMNKLADIRLANSAPTAGDSDGDVDMVGETWHWRMKISATDVASMLRIDVNVAPKSAGENASIANVSGFYGKAMATTGQRIGWDPQGGGPTGSSSSSSQSSSSSSSTSSASGSG